MNLRLLIIYRGSECPGVPKKVVHLDGRFYMLIDSHVLQLGDIERGITEIHDPPRTTHYG